MKNHKLNKAYFIDCEDYSESSNTNAKSLYEETLKYSEYITHNFFSIISGDDLLKTLDLISLDANADENILIYIYMHGSNERNGLIDAHKKLLTWDKIIEKIRPINIKTNNGLFLIMSSCHGIFLTENLDIAKKVPFNTIIASKYEEKVNNIYDLFHDFFASLVRENNTVKAFLNAKKDDTNFFYKDSQTLLEYAINSLSKKMNSPEYIINMYEEHKLKVPTSFILSKSEYDITIKVGLQKTIAQTRNNFFFSAKKDD